MSAPASLRRRLWIAGAGALAAGVVVAAFALGAAFERSAERVLERRLDEDLDRLIARVERDPALDRYVLLREPTDERYRAIFSGWYWAARDARGLRQSRSGWDQGVLDRALEAARERRSSLQLDGPRDQPLAVRLQRVRFANGDVLPLAVAGSRAEVLAETRDVRLLAGLAMAAIAACLLLAMAWQVRYGLRPLRRIEVALARLRRGERVRFGELDLPAEVAPLAREVDALLDQHARQVERARGAAQDLAHALKTPLAVLRLDAQRPDAELGQRVLAQVERMQAAVERYLAGPMTVDPRQRCDVRGASLSLIGLMRQLHRERAPEFAVEVPSTIWFGGSREDLEELLGNLLDNACKWARRRVRVRAGIAAGRLQLDVDDDGPGLDEAGIAAAPLRGVRLDERVPGSGLGLSIVRSVAVAYGGRLQLAHSDLGGVSARLDLPGGQGSG